MKNDYQKKDVEIAYEKGYRVINEEVYSPTLQIRKVEATGNGYLKFSIRRENRQHVKIFVHQLVAYQKFGEQMFQSGIQVRHLDGDKLNNKEDNIAIGTQSENILDRSPEDRLNHSLLAASHNRKFTNEEVEQIRYRYSVIKSYKKIMLEFNISSKGTLHYILTHNYQT